MTSALASALHIMGLMLTTVAILVRDRALRDPSDHENHKTLDIGDTAMIFTSLLLIGAGFWRLLAGLEKPTDWYLENHVFWGKMAFVAIISTVESYLMVNFFKWRFQKRRGEPLDLKNLKLIRALNRSELVLSVIVVFFAAAMAHGVGAPSIAAASAAEPGDACAVQSVFASRCVSCHNPAARLGSLDLQTDAHAALVGVKSSQWPTESRVVAGEPERSLLWAKLEGRQGAHGVPMPMGQPPLPEGDRRLIRDWIAAGAAACQN